MKKLHSKEVTYVYYLMVSVGFAFYRLLHVKNYVKFTKLETKQIAFYCRNE